MISERIIHERNRIPATVLVLEPLHVIQIQLEADAFDPGHAIDSPDGSYTLEQAINDEFPDPDVAEIANQLVKSPDPAGDLQKYLELWQVERTTM